VTTKSVTVRVARWSATHPWRAVALWLVFVAACVVVGGAVGSRQATDRDLGVGESGRATTMEYDGGLAMPAVENVLITARSGPLAGIDAGATASTDAGVDAAVAEVARRFRDLPEVAAVGDPVTAPDGSAVLIPVTMRGDPDTAGDRVAALLAATEAAQRAHPDLRIEQVGRASVDKGINDLVAQDLGKAEKLSLPLTLLIMVVVFGAIVAAGVPVLLALSAVAAAIGLSTLATHVVPDVGTVNSVILLMGMAVGVDYSLFYLKREREERARGLGHIDAIEIAAATSGRAVVVSGLAVIVSMSGLYLTADAIFASLATGSVIVVAVAMLGSLTVLPALLGKLGRWVDRPRVPLVWRLTNRAGGPPRLWPALLRPALRRPGVTLVVSVLALGALALPALGMTLRNTGADALPRTIPVVQAYDRMTAAFPDQSSSHNVVVRAAATQAGAVRAALAELARRTGADPAAVRASADGRVHALTVAVPYEDTSPQAAESLRALRSDLVPATVGAVPGAEYAVGGYVAESLDYSTHQVDKLPWVIGFVLALTLVIMAVTFRSIVVALTAIAVNLLSAGAAFGLLVLVFQHRWAEGLLGFHSTGAVVAWVPLFLFVVLFGLSMDYHVFVVSRIREAAKSGLPARAAVADGIIRSAGVVTSAAAVMVTVFAIFAGLTLMDMKQMGVGLAAAVLIDAVVIRVVVLPSLMALLGSANWWPSRLARSPEPARTAGRPPQRVPVAAR